MLKVKLNAEALPFFDRLVKEFETSEFLEPAKLRLAEFKETVPAGAPRQPEMRQRRRNARAGTPPALRPTRPHQRQAAPYTPTPTPTTAPTPAAPGGSTPPPPAPPPSARSL